MHMSDRCLEDVSAVTKEMLRNVSMSTYEIGS